MDAIDMHAHWSPRGLVRQSAAGKDWYGWRVFKDATGREHIALGERILAFAASTSLMDDPAARAEMRQRDEGIGFQALMLTGTFFNYHLDETAAAAFCREVNEEVADIQHAFPDRYAAAAGWAKVRDGSVPVDGGWRIYSSGPGLFTNLLVRHGRAT